jgi:hypothetical protein
MAAPVREKRARRFFRTRAAIFIWRRWLLRKGTDVADYRDLGTNLRLIRVARGLSQHRLGVRAGFTGVYISQLERGLKPSSDDHVDRLAAALDVPPEALMATGTAERLLGAA